MNTPPPATYTVAIPGTDETQELTRQDLLAKMAKGEITSAHWVWSPEAEDWKQISEIPDLQPTRKPATGGVGSFFRSSRSKNEPDTAVVPAAQRKTSSRRKTGSSSSRSSRNRKSEGIPVFSLLFAFIFFAAAGVIGVNYVLVEEPMDDNIAQTPFVLVPVHAHMGGFVQPNAVVIHVLPSREVTADNFSDLLYTLASSTPPQPFTQKPFGIVELTPAWLGEYAFTGADWQQLAAMDHASAEDRKNFVLDHLASPHGEPLIPGADKLDASDLKAAREKVWDELIASFLSKPVAGPASLITTEGIQINKPG